MIIYDELFKRASFQFNIILTYMTFLKKMTIDLWPIMRWKDVQLSMRVIKMYELILDHTLGCSRVKTQNFLMMCLMKRDNEFRLGGDMVRNSSYLPFLLHLVIYDFFWPCSAPWLVMWLVWVPIFIPLISFISFCWGVVIRRQNKSEKIFKKTDLNFF